MTEPDEIYYQQIPEAPDLPHRLGRNVAHDPRSRAFAFAPSEPRPIVDVAWKRRVPAYDQGADVRFRGVVYHGLGSCTFNAAAGAMSTLPHRHRYRSQQHIAEGYARATEIDPFLGTFPTEDTGSSGLAVAKVAFERKKISRYEHIFTFDALLQALMVGPVIEGTIWGYDGFHPEPDGRVHFTGGVAGGHEYQTFGVDVEHRRLWHWQSWGTRWGVAGGRFYTTWDDQRDALAQDGDATVLVP